MPIIKDFQWLHVDKSLPALIQSNYSKDYYTSNPVLLRTISGRFLIAQFTCFDDPDTSKLTYKWYVNESDTEIPKPEYWCYIGKVNHG